MDDEVVSGVWELDPDTRLGLRIQRVRGAVSDGDWPRVVTEAEELLDEAPEHTEALGLLATALLELGDAESAAEAFEDHLSQAGPDALMLSGLAIARFESCDVMGAVEAARESIRLDPGLAEAHYTLGLSLERLGDAAEAARSFQAAHALDGPAYPFPLALTDPDIEAALQRAVTRLDPTYQDFWVGIPVRIEEEPTLAELTASPPPLPPTVAGLYEGSPPADDEEALTARPTALRVFRRNLARCGDLDEVAEQLAQVLQQEALDWLGIPPDELGDANDGPMG
ncbi:MAG: tetratricopeptide repeat protein [Myxococcota bacterium]